jgi:8-oxo-dGTP diphosphatase
MHCYISEIIGGKLKLNDHNDAKWISFEELNSQRWVPADILVVDVLKAL